MPQITAHIFWSFLNEMMRTIWFSNLNFRFFRLNSKYTVPLVFHDMTPRICMSAQHILLMTDFPWVTKDNSKAEIILKCSCNWNFCSFHTLTDIIWQFNPFLKGTSVTSQSRDNVPYDDDLYVAFIGASARSEYIQLIQTFLHRRVVR